MKRFVGKSISFSSSVDITTQGTQPTRSLEIAARGKPRRENVPKSHKKKTKEMKNYPINPINGHTKLQTDLHRLGDWAVENKIKINPSKSKALSFTRVRVKDPLNYTLRDEKIPEDSSCKYLGIIIRSDLSWADQVNNMVQKAWRALHFVMRVLKGK
jgi:hypothetical protein